ncbi:hypothetical protein EVU96_08985 [Bacillus infantis]|uniref:hypothetical protein n=1 Tax=Bacillus infantis TaxID=324767 RepID=UPI00101DF17C|nr:hypothetical protein [Bacillus infantis]RYI30539.1 hypothetical protein EVU96_08985 [Bacillus infantis]
MKKSNEVYSLSRLQYAYLPITLKYEAKEEQCCLCWKTLCKCDHDLASDSFINLTEPDTNYTDEELQYA